MSDRDELIEQVKGIHNQYSGIEDDEDCMWGEIIDLCTTHIKQDEWVSHETLKKEAKIYIDANIWDGEDRSGAINDRASFNPDELQEIINDMLDSTLPSPPTDKAEHK